MLKKIIFGIVYYCLMVMESLMAFREANAAKQRGYNPRKEYIRNAKAVYAKFAGIDCSGFVTRVWGIRRNTTADFHDDNYVKKFSKRH